MTEAMASKNGTGHVKTNLKTKQIIVPTPDTLKLVTVPAQGRPTVYHYQSNWVVVYQS